MLYLTIKILGIIIMPMPVTPSGGMYFHPYKYPTWVKIGKKLGTPVDRLGHITGAWTHNPYHVAYRAVKGGGLATTVGVGNFLTRNYRQKPVVGLQTATHTRAPKAPNSVSIPTVSSRRTKDYSRKKILSRIKAMPYRKKYTRTGKKRIYRRTKHRPKIPLGFPRKKLVRFRLFANNTLSGAGGNLATAMIKANSLNDPMGAAGTQLPHTLDQWAAFYEKYTILGAKITVKFALTTNTGAVHAGVHLHKNSTALTNSAHYREVGMTKMKTLTTQRDQGTVVMKYSGKRFWHLGSITSDSEQEATFSTTPGDPTDIAYFHVFLQDVVGANNADADYSVELEFLCLLNEPINIARSSL